MKKILAIVTAVASIGAFSIVASAEGFPTDNVPVEEPPIDVETEEDPLAGEDVTIDLNGDEIGEPVEDVDVPVEDPDPKEDANIEDDLDMLNLLNSDNNSGAGTDSVSDSPIENVVPDVTPTVTPTNVTPTPVIVNNTNTTPVQPVTSTPKTGNAAPIGASLAAVLTAVGGIVVKKKI